MRRLRAISPRVSRLIRGTLLVLWVLQMAALMRSVFAESSASLAADLGRYGKGAQWHGVYYRGEKIGFTVSQTVETPTGFDLEEDGRLQMSLLGASTAARIRTIARVDRAFSLKSFSFSLDPGSGPVSVEGTLEGLRLHLSIRTPSSTRTDVRELKEPPLLSLNLPRRLAAEGLAKGKHLELLVFDPATLRNAPMSLDVKGREVVVVAGRPIPVFRVEMSFSGLTSTTFVTDLGEVLREESPSGLFIVREPQEQALALAVPGAVQMDLLQASAVVPEGGPRIDDPVSVEKLRLRLSGVEVSPAELQGEGQSFSGDVLETRNLREARPGPGDASASRFLDPEPFIESDAPEIRHEVERALERVADNPSAQAERLVRYVNSLLEKKPTVSLPSALEVLRTKVGDCNEHAVLFVAMARAARIPSRLAVGLVYLHGAFYYHAWAEVYVAYPRGEGLWLPVDPTLNQFPADATHLRFARGGLDQQAVIAKFLGRLRITVLGVESRPGTVPILVGRAETDTRPPDIPLPRRDGSGPTCWSRPSS